MEQVSGVEHYNRTYSCVNMQTGEGLLQSCLMAFTNNLNLMP